MNSLSWLIYLAGVADKGSSLLGFLCFFASLGLLVSTIAYLITVAFAAADDRDALRAKPVVQTIWLTFLGAFPVVFMLWIALPTHSTVMAIAASEVGEKIITNENVTGLAADANKALRGWISKQIDGK